MSASRPEPLRVFPFSPARNIVVTATVNTWQSSCDDNYSAGRRLGVEPMDTALERVGAGSKGRSGMNTKVETKERDVVLVQDAAWIRVMGQPVLEALPSARAPYAQVDPFILVHEARGRLSPDIATWRPSTSTEGSTTCYTCLR